MIPFFRPLTLLCFWLTLASGCQRVWIEDPGNRLGLAELLEPIPGELQAVSLFPLEKSRGRFLIVEGDEDGLVFEWKLKPDGDEWLYLYDGLQQVWLVQDGQGGLRIRREDDLEEEVQVTYEPGLLMLPRHLYSGAVETQTVSMTVRSLDGRELRSQGICVNTVSLVGTQKISTPAGEFQAILVRSHRQIQLPIARVDVEILSAYVPEKGQVAERVIQKIRALNLFDLQEVREIRLAP